MAETPEGEIIQKIREAERQVEDDLKRAEADASRLIEAARTEAADEVSRARAIVRIAEVRAREESARNAAEAAAEVVSRAEAEASAFRGRTKDLVPDLAAWLADRILPPAPRGSAPHSSPGKTR